MPTVYPCVVGHEILGRVTKVGSAVSKFKPGDLAAVGCMVDSDGTCPECQAGLEQFCPNPTFTYNFPDKHLGGVTYGGYSESVVVDQRFVLRFLEPQPGWSRSPALRRNYNLLALAALGRNQGQEGRCGRSRRTGPHGREVRTCPRSPHGCLYDVGSQERRRPSPRSRRGRPFAPCGRDAETRRQLRLHSRLCLSQSRHSLVYQSVAPGWHDRAGRRARETPRRPCLRVDHGTPQPGGIAHRRYRRNPGNARFLRQHNITSDVEVIPIQKVNEAYERLLKSDVKYRLSIDMASLKNE